MGSDPTRISIAAAIAVTLVFLLLWIGLQAWLFDDVRLGRTALFGAACLVLLVVVQWMPRTRTGRGMLRLGELLNDLLHARR